MMQMGLGNIDNISFGGAVDAPDGCYGKMKEVSAGKDTTTGHWEIAGVQLKRPFPTFPDGFPQDFIEKFEQATGRGTLGNKPASGTAILDELGEAELARCIAYIDQSAQSTGNRNRWQDWGLILRRCSRESWGIRQEKSAPKQGTETIGWHGAAYDEGECTPEEKAAAAAEFESMKAYLAKLKARDGA